MSNVTIVVGAQWGDEGKGKWIDVLASKADLVARFQGGNNAGHTLYVKGQKIVLHQIPSGIFNDDKVSAITAGVVVNPVQLLIEMEEIRKVADITPEKFWISTRAHVITPWHIHLDSKSESSAKQPIGTTKRGIGPTYSDRASRLGMRIGTYCSPKEYQRWVSMMVETSNEFKSHYETEKAEWKAFEGAQEKIRTFACESESKVRREVRKGKKILLEGAQGTLLDVNYGTYPFVTSSSTTAGGALASVGLSPKTVGNIVGIAKAYITRVGEGPFPTELTDDIGKELGKKGNEFGATTNRPRRCGWYDAVAMRYAAEVNGLDGIYVNKLDILSGFKTLKIATSYEHPELGNITEFPACATVLAQLKPVYAEYPGWDEEIPSTGNFSDLPQAAQDYVRAVEKHSGVRILFVGTGPNREDAIEVPTL